MCLRIETCVAESREVGESEQKKDQVASGDRETQDLVVA